MQNLHPVFPLQLQLVSLRGNIAVPALRTAEPLAEPTMENEAKSTAAIGTPFSGKFPDPAIAFEHSSQDVDCSLPAEVKSSNLSKAFAVRDSR
jgi:hypothetical protein